MVGITRIIGATSGGMFEVSRTGWKPAANVRDIPTRLAVRHELLDEHTDRLFSAACENHRSSEGWLIDLSSESEVSRPVLCIPLERTAASSFVMALFTLTELDTVWCSEVAATAIKAMLSMKPGAGSDMMSTLVDALKRSYGSVPHELHARRYAAFQSELEHLGVAFEPVVRLSAMERDVRIWSWEALARDPRTDRAPVALFGAAELWGREFAIELDSTMARRAIAAYEHAIDTSEFGKGPALPLSINVSPSSLLSQAYVGSLSDAIRGARVHGENIVLEISEKEPIVAPPDTGGEGPFDSFLSRLRTIRQDLDVGFAIDDFGVGHASSHRLGALSPAQVKLDREILNQYDALHEIELVLRITSRFGPHHNRVVVKGIDADVPISIEQLYGIGVRNIQGDLVQAARPDLVPLSSQTKALIASACARAFGRR